MRDIGYVFLWVILRAVSVILRNQILLQLNWLKLVINHSVQVILGKGFFLMEIRCYTMDLERLGGWSGSLHWCHLVWSCCLIHWVCQALQVLLKAAWLGLNPWVGLLITIVLSIVVVVMDRYMVGHTCLHVILRLKFLFIEELLLGLLQQICLFLETRLVVLWAWNIQIALLDCVVWLKLYSQVLLLFLIGCDRVVDRARLWDRANIWIHYLSRLQNTLWKLVWILVSILSLILRGQGLKSSLISRLL